MTIIDQENEFITWNLVFSPIFTVKILLWTQFFNIFKFAPTAWRHLSYLGPKLGKRVKHETESWQKHEICYTGQVSGGEYRSGLSCWKFLTLCAMYNVIDLPWHHNWGNDVIQTSYRRRTNVIQTSYSRHTAVIHTSYIRHTYYENVSSEVTLKSYFLHCQYRMSMVETSMIQCWW